jgi:hypothetical protein
MDSYSKLKVYFERVASISETPAGEESKRHADVLNTKISALLTHVSLMIAVSAVFFDWASKPTGHLPFLEWMLLAEIVAYVLISLLCLRGIWITGYSSFLEHKGDPTEVFFKIVGARRTVYYIAISSTIFVTVAFLATLIGEAAVRINT